MHPRTHKNVTGMWKKDDNEFMANGAITDRIVDVMAKSRVNSGSQLPSSASDLSFQSISSILSSPEMLNHVSQKVRVCVCMCISAFLP